MKITINHNNFVDLIVLFLLDQLTKKEQKLEYSEESQEFFEEIERKGMKSVLLKHFFDTDAEMRRNYKFINEVFNEKTDNRQVIYLEQGVNNE